MNRTLETAPSVHLLGYKHDNRGIAVQFQAEAKTILFQTASRADMGSTNTRILDHAKGRASRAASRAANL
jgi:hypothetical protein